MGFGVHDFSITFSFIFNFDDCDPTYQTHGPTSSVILSGIKELIFVYWLGMSEEKCNGSQKK